MTTISVTIETLSKVMPFMIEQRVPILIRGRHGIGKSEIAKQLADKRGLPLLNLRAGLFTEGEQLGLPVQAEEYTTYKPPKWLYTACTQPVILFLDELDRGILEVRQGFFQLADSREIAGWELHADTIVLAAINGGEGASQYQVGDLDPAELDRWATFDLEPSIKDWLRWGEGTVHPSILSFIEENAEHLEHKGDFNPGRIYPSRRSWYRFSKVLSTHEDILDSLGSVTTIGASLVGLEAALSFEKYIKTNGIGLTPEDVIDKGKMDGIKKMPIGALSTLVEKIDIKGYWGKRLTNKQLKHLGEFFNTVPKEIAAKIWIDVTSNLAGKQLERTIKVGGMGSRLDELFYTEELRTAIVPE